MTEFDKKLIEKANKFSRYDYNDVAVLMQISETKEARMKLNNIRCELRDLVRETI